MPVNGGLRNRRTPEYVIDGEPAQAGLHQHVQRCRQHAFAGNGDTGLRAALLPDPGGTPASKAEPGRFAGRPRRPCLLPGTGRDVSAGPGHPQGRLIVTGLAGGRVPRLVAAAHQRRGDHEVCGGPVAGDWNIADNRDPEQGLTSGSCGCGSSGSHKSTSRSIGPRGGPRGLSPGTTRRSSEVLAGRGFAAGSGCRCSGRTTASIRRRFSSAQAPR